MAEYIERDALLQDIEDSVRITSKTGMINPETRVAYKIIEYKIIERIKSTAAADVVAVVRCKECKKQELSIYKNWLFCTKHGKCMRPEDYCSYGERKEGAD